MNRIDPEARAERMAKRCTVPGCGRPEFATGHCTMHLQRLRRNGTLELRRKPRCRCHPEAHRVGCEGSPKPLAEEDHPLLVHLLDLLEPQLHAGESLLALTRRLIATSAKYHEVTWNPEGRDAG